MFDASFANYRPNSTTRWFRFCISLTDVKDIEQLNTSEVTGMKEMFWGCESLESIDVSGFNTKKVKDRQ